jgi:hypothetical protein
MKSGGWKTIRRIFGSGGIFVSSCREKETHSSE